MHFMPCLSRLSSCFFIPSLLIGSSFGFPANDRPVDAAAAPSSSKTRELATTTTRESPNAHTLIPVPECWVPRDKYIPTIVRPNDCRDAINKVLRLPLPDKPRIFTPWFYRDETGRLRPSIWQVGGCFLYVRSTKPNAVAELRFADVADRADFISRGCVDVDWPRRPTGGWTGLGSWHNGFFVAVSGSNPQNAAAVGTSNATAYETLNLLMGNASIHSEVS